MRFIPPASSLLKQIKLKFILKFPIQLKMQLLQLVYIIYNVFYYNNEIIKSSFFIFIKYTSTLHIKKMHVSLTFF
jgi:hypothetical protein